MSAGALNRVEPYFCEKKMGITDARVDAYIAGVRDFARPVMVHLRKLVHEACPEVEETWKWSFPNFMYRGKVLCSMAAFKEHCAFNFWKAALIKDDDKILTVADRSSMGNLGKIYGINDLPPDGVMIKYLHLAMQLADEDVKMPRKKPTDQEKKELLVPECLLKALDQAPEAREIFEKFSYSHKKEYCEWIGEAKTQPTKEKRVAQAIEWIAKGKGRNWKYENS